MTTLLLLACGTSPSEEVVTVDLSPREKLLRVSVDLLGVHPSETDLAAFEANPSDEAYAGYVDAWLRDPRFLTRTEEIWNLTFRTRTGDTYFDPAEAGLSLDSRVVADSLGEEPLKLASYIVANDLPWSQIVLAEHTMADATSAAMWGYSLAGDGSAWGPAYYTDGRPAAGVLSMTSVWQRYPSAGSNANRHRANQVSRMFLCDDYLSRPVEFSRNDVEAATTEELEEVIRTNATCTGCHSSLDPLAAHFFGFWWEKDETLAARRTYYAGDESMWTAYANRAPNYYGTPTTGLRSLGEHIAADERFVDCTVRTVFEAYHQRPALADDWTELQAHKAAFEAEGLRMRALVKSILTADSYTRPVDSAIASSVRTASPEQLRTIIADKTGYDWTFEGRSGLSVVDLGLPVLAGGTDGRYVTDRNYQPTVSSVFVQERLAQVAGYRVAASDLAGETMDNPILLRYVTVQAMPDVSRAAFEEQVKHLYLELTGMPLEPGAPEIEENIALWQQVFSVTSSPTSSWAAVIAAVLRDPRLLFY